MKGIIDSSKIFSINICPKFLSNLREIENFLLNHNGEELYSKTADTICIYMYVWYIKIFEKYSCNWKKRKKATLNHWFFNVLKWWWLIKMIV